jgi:ribosomal protein L11 methyltransferase
MQQLTLHVDAGTDASYLSNVLLETFGALSVTVTDRRANAPNEEPLLHHIESDGGDCGPSHNVLVDGADRAGVPIWTSAVITAHFPGPPECSLEQVTMALLADADVSRSRVVGAAPVADDVLAKNWVAHVQQSFTAVTIGGLRVRAPWHARDSPGGAVEMILTPGQAFGTGEHPTTQLCATWLQDFASARRGTPWTVLDYGCGSGILAIAAVLLGAASAVGCDVDDKAVETATENATANGCADRVRIGGDAFEAALFADGIPGYTVVVANMLAGTLKGLAPRLAARVGRGGALVLSGILAEQASAVSDVFSLHGIAMEGAAVRAGWTLLVGRRP